MEILGPVRVHCVTVSKTGTQIQIQSVVNEKRPCVVDKVDVKSSFSQSQREEDTPSNSPQDLVIRSKFNEKKNKENILTVR